MSGVIVLAILLVASMSVNILFCVYVFWTKKWQNVTASSDTVTVANEEQTYEQVDDIKPKEVDTKQNVAYGHDVTSDPVTVEQNVAYGCINV